MARIKEGIVFTNERCIGCNRCITKCPIQNANNAIIQDGKSHVFINVDKCVSCAECVRPCTHGARDYHDDLSLFMGDLKQKEKISVIVSSTFFTYYKEKANNILGYLKYLGVENIYTDYIGSELSIWAHVRYLIDHENDSPKERAFIANTCPSVVRTIERYYPDLVNKIIPVHDSTICSAIYAKKYCNEKNKLAYIGPCVAASNEIHDKRSHNYFDYSITISKLLKEISDVDISSYNFEPKDNVIRIGFLQPMPGSLKKCVELNFKHSENFIYLSGLNSASLKALEFNSKEQNTPSQPFLLEISSCENGCMNGPGIERTEQEANAVYHNYKDYHKQIYSSFNEEINYMESREFLLSHFTDYNYQDFITEFHENYKQDVVVPKSTCYEIFEMMHKTTKAKRHINCGACGYETCHQMVYAIANGYNHKENCIHFMKEENYRKNRIDSVTNLPNKVGFLEQFEKMVKENPNKSFLLFYGEINNFNVINGMYERKVGEHVLQSITKEFTDYIDNRGLIGIFANNAFAFAIQNESDVMPTLRSVQQFDCKSVGIEMPITMRFGVVEVTEDFENPEKYIKRAQLAMSYSKQSSHNTFTMYTEEMHNKMMMEVEITSQMQTAMNNDEFVLYFQPQYSINGYLVGAECLCRWIKKDGSIVSPGLFIPASEKNGYIRPLDRIIWEKAFKTIRLWLDEGLEVVPISINISRLSLDNESLIFIIERFKNQYNISPELVHFEVTESAYVADQDKIVERINKIRDMGFKIAMDDFGSGYSSLNALKDIPIDYLKLDMGFFKGTENMAKGGNIVASVARMAQDLGYITIAEGVETKEQANFLKTIGCDIIQGFIYGKPMPSDDFKDLLYTANKGNLVQGNTVVKKSKLDVLKLYDPNSAESIMFESFSGPALIVEYEKDKFSIVRTNDKTLKLFGMEEMSFTDVQNSFVNNVDKKNKDIFMKAANKAIVTGMETTCETCHRRYDNNMIIYIKTHIWCLNFTSERYTIYALLEDITKEKESTNTLTLANNQMSLVMDHSQVGMLLLHVNVNKKGTNPPFTMKVITCNQQMEEISGYKKSEIMQWNEKSGMSQIHPLDRAKVLIEMSQFVSNNYSLDIIYRARVKNRAHKYSLIRLMASAIENHDGSFSIITNYIQVNKKEKILHKQKLRKLIKQQRLAEEQEEWDYDDDGES